MNCESCEHYDYDEEYEAFVCKLDLDEDEYLKFITNNTQNCPYYKYYDEYKSVRRQNQFCRNQLLCAKHKFTCETKLHTSALNG